MTPLQYLRYLIQRIGKALATLLAFTFVCLALQWLGAFHQSNWKPVIRPVNRFALRTIETPVIRAPGAKRLEWWTYPVLAGLLGYLFFGPKQRRPIYLYYGARFARAYAKVKQDFNAAARGDLVTGATGTGKCLHPDTLVQIHGGTPIAAHQITPGALLVDPSGSAQPVLSVSRGFGEMFQIIPEKGNPWGCNHCHVMTLAHADGRVIDIPLDQHLRRVASKWTGVGNADVSTEWKLLRITASGARELVDWSCQPAGDGHYCGCTLGGSRRFLLADGTVTHNTQICLNPINESQTVHMRGIERPDWKNSPARREYAKLKSQYFRQTAALRKELKDAVEARNLARTKTLAKATEQFAATLFPYLVRAYNKLDGQSLTAVAAAPQSEEDIAIPPLVIGAEEPAPLKPRDKSLEPPPPKDDVDRLMRAGGGNQIAPNKLKFILEETSTAALLMDRPLTLPPGCPRDLQEAGVVWQQARRNVQLAEDTISIVQNKIALRRLELSRAADILRPIRYANYPWGGAIFDQKGNCAQQQQPMLERYDRPEDIIVLQVRPRGAAQWSPANTINLLSYEGFPADTYAKLIVDTYNQVEECDKPDPFFVPKARNAIADGIRLLRAIRDAQLKLPNRPPEICAPSFSLLYSILKDYVPYKAPEGPKAFGGEFYWTFMEKCGAIPDPELKAKNPSVRAMLESNALTDAIEQLRTSYWSQPTDQLGGVAGTLDNFLAPFSEPEIKEIFCAGNTCNFTDAELGKIFTVSIPQRFAVQRAYIATIISQVLYQIIQNRFDANKETSFDWSTRNVLRQEKDEAQRLATDADMDVDTIREAQGSTALASQSQPALWRRFGGKDKAAAPLGNLRNRFICRAATSDCAEESAKMIGKAMYDESSSSGKTGEESSVSVSTKEHYIISPERLLSLPDFNVIFSPADGEWLYVHVVPCPVQPNGLVPPWWYGEANLVKIVAWLFHIPQHIPRRILWKIPTGPLGGFRILWFDPSKIIPFWRAKCWEANRRIGWRYLLGLDTTWYIVDRMSREDAKVQANRRDHLSKG